MKKILLSFAGVVIGNLWLSAQCSFTGLNATYSTCDPQATLTGNPAGGGFSGPGITGNNFNPGAAGIGTHTISYFGAYTVNQFGPYAPATQSTPNFITLSDDQLSGILPIGFSFIFYGNTYTSFYISSNGFISFDAAAGSGCCSGQFLPDINQPNNIIACAWEDLYPPAGGTISYSTIGTAPNRILVVRYSNIPHYTSGNLVSSQIQLYEGSNIIEIHTASMPSDGGSHTMGIENANGTLAAAVPGRNSANWSVSNDYVQFVPCSSSQTVTVTTDLVPPTINGPADITVSAAPGTCGAAVTYTVPSCANNAEVYVSQPSVDHVDGNASNTLFPNVVADDIVIPGGDCWSINRITTTFWMSGVPNDATGFNILMYNDAAGMPGTLNSTVVVPAANITPTFITNTLGYNVYQLVMTLPTSIDLCSGTYWIGIQAINTESAYDYYWEYMSPGTAGSPAYENFLGPWNSLGRSYTMILENTGGLGGGDLTDNCTACPTLTQTAGLASGATFPVGTTTVTFQAQDAAGNSATHSFNVIVTESDNPVPVLASLPDFNSQCEVTAFTAPTATDLCAGTITGTHNATLPISGQGITVITWTYDDGNGNTTTQTQNVVIDDVTAPVPNISQLANVTGECAVNSLIAPTALDNCAGTVTGTHNAALPITAPGTTIVTWSFDDGNGNLSTQTQNVIIADTEAPVPTSLILPIVTSECEIVSLTEPSAVDNCSAVTVTNNATLPITTQGNTVVTWTYTDAAGNFSTQTQSIVLQDLSEPTPVVASLPNVEATCEVTVLNVPTASDNCSGPVAVSSDAVLPILADQTVTWTYTDENGNTSTQTQQVTIIPVDASVSISGTTISANNTNSNSTYQWIDCDNGNSPITGATASSYTPTTTGNYAVEVTEGSCTEVSECTLIDFSGLTQLSSMFIHVYPNPASSMLNVETSVEGTLDFYDVSGKLILTRNVHNGTNELNVRALATGTYTVRLTTLDGVNVVRVVIDRQ